MFWAVLLSILKYKGCFSTKVQTEENLVSPLFFGECYLNAKQQTGDNIWPLKQVLLHDTPMEASLG